MKGIENVHQFIEGWVAENKIPGAVIDIQVKDKLQWQAAYGTASRDTIFDVASLTKVAATLPAIMTLVQSGRVSLQDPIQTYIPEFRHPAVTIEHCLKHVSGLPSGVPDFKDRYKPLDIRQIFELELESRPGERVNYSDIGMILIGWIVSRLTQQPLDEWAREHVFEPLGMKDSYFNPPETLRDRIAPTEWDGQKYILGEVHDETCYRLGGVAGSAGLFSTAEDLARYAKIWLYPERYSLLSKETVDACLKPVFQGRGLGWQVQGASDEGLSCGPNWPEGSFGHTGFTGTSMWINPVDEMTVVFLTNGVHLGREHNELRHLRPILHEAALSIVKP